MDMDPEKREDTAHSPSGPARACHKRLVPQLCRRSLSNTLSNFGRKLPIPTKFSDKVFNKVSKMRGSETSQGLPPFATRQLPQSLLDFRFSCGSLDG